MNKNAGKTLLAISLMLAPFIIAVIYERSHGQPPPTISSIAIIPAKFHGSEADAPLATDIDRTLLQQFRASPSLRVETGEGNDPIALGNQLGVDAVMAVSVTVDSGVIEISVKIMDSKTGEALWDTPYEGPRDKYADIARAAGETAKAALHLK